MAAAESKVTLAAYARLIGGNRNFRLLWMAQIVSEIGDWLYSVAVYSLLIEYTGSAKSIALAFVLQVLPQFFTAPLAGVINDRLSRRRVMIFADWTRAAIVLAMLLVRSPVMIWFLYALLFLETVLWALFEPARNSVVPNIAGNSEIVVANALSSTTWSFNFAVGFTIGGAIAAFFGRPTVFVLNAVSFIISALLIRRMQFDEPHTALHPPLRFRDLVDFSPIVEGVRYVSGDRRLLSTIFVKFGLGLMGANWVILPMMGEKLYPISLPGITPERAGMLGMSVLMGSRGVGALIGPFVGNYWAGHSQRRFRWGILAGFVIGGLGYVALGVTHSLAAACFAVALAHAGGSMIWVFSSTLLQQLTEDRYRGRVFSTEFAFMVISMSLSSTLAGNLADQGLPLREVAIVTGLLVALPAAAWAFAMRLWPVPE